MASELQLTPETKLRRGGPRRTAAQWFVLVFNTFIGLALLIAAVGVWYGNRSAASIGRVVTADPSAGVSGPSTMAPAQYVLLEDEAPPETAPETLAPTTSVAQPIDVSARNYLLTGTDNNSCVDPDSPYAGAFGNRDSFGARSDAIIIMRIDPGTGQAAILSFPRDLWVKIPGSGRGRINQAVGTGNANRLEETIFNEFGIAVDHYINVDFCAFKRIVDEIGGVAVPFEFPAKDRYTGLNVTEVGCHTMMGDEALAYVRSRHYKYLDPDTGEYREDPSSDLGRVTRQQDFIKRVLRQAINKGARNPSVAAGIVGAITDQAGVTLDESLTVAQLLDVALAMKDFNPERVKTFQIEAKPEIVGNAAVLKPLIGSDRMKAVLAVFRGEASMAEASEQVIVAPTEPAPTLPTFPDPNNTGSTNATVAPVSTLPPIEVIENPKGIFPPTNVTC